MKHIYLFIAGLFMSISLIAQQVPREMVVLEIGTGTWCQYCPGAAMGADDLVENGCHVAVVENHNGDTYANQYSNTRNSFYALTGYPTAIFDGLLKVSGGSHTQSMYSNYLPKYNQRMAISSDFIMDMVVTNVDLDYTAVITIDYLGTSAPTGAKLQFFVTQSNIAQNWQGQTELNFVNRLMVPDQNGTVLDFSGTNQVIVTLNFTMDSSVPIEDVEFVAAIQATNKEMLQGIKLAAIDLAADFVAASTQVAPNTSVTFTNSTTGGYMHAPETYKWYFPGGDPAISTDENPSVTYAQCGTYDVSLVVDRGGQIDSIGKPAYISVGDMTAVNMVVTPNDTACVNWSVSLDATTTAAASYLWQPGDVTTASMVADGSVYGVGEHTFTVTVTSEQGCVVSKEQKLYFDACTSIGNADLRELALYPNPAQELLTIELQEAGLSHYTVTSANGSQVMKGSFSSQSQTLNVKSLANGIYMLKIEAGEKMIVRRFVISR